METYFLVDYENVGSSGLSNCSGLTETDHIILFYTNNANKINLDFINEHGNAELKTIRVPSKSQSIDMHIVSYMGYLIGENKGKNIRIIVVSKDKDYDNLIEFWKKAETANVSRIQKINLSVKNDEAKEKTDQNKSQSSNKSKKASTKSNVKNELNNQIQKVMSESGYATEAINSVAQLVTKQYGKKNFKQCVHNELSRAYSDFESIYKNIKHILELYC